MNSRICISFICQAGELELKAALLAASLRLNHQSLKTELVAAIPDKDVWGDIASQTRCFLENLDIRIERVVSPFGEAYPIGNKIAALGVPTDASTTIFLDSDIVCLTPFDPVQLETPGLLAKPADFDTFRGNVDQCQLAYDAFGLALPTSRAMSSVGNEVMMPYFNAGVVAVRDGPRFSECWLETSRVIDGMDSIENKRPWLDQISLPIAAARMEYESSILDESYNYPAHNIRLKQDRLPILCHYHWPAVLQQEPMLVKLVNTLAKQHPELEKMIGERPEWRSLLNSPFLPASRNRGGFFGRSKPKKYRNDFLVTGIPRSGTSLICNVINRMPDTVVINEPEEVFTTLNSTKVTYQFDLYYRSLRADIVHGRKIENKISENGDITEDTRLDDTRRQYSPEISRPDFHLGTKNPLAYLTRLRWLCDNHPGMLKIATIRHPFSTIASWINSFDHLKQVDHRTFPFGGLDDPLLDACQRDMIAEILEQPSAAVRRALLWNYLSEMIWRDREKLLLIKYEDLLDKPVVTLQHVFRALSYTGNPRKLVATVRSATSEPKLPDVDRYAITHLCGKQMARWGYN
ncbi:MAG: sulfotransferase [Proteobacteria bacterium]|nr:sulfotransferase [Pseudomonadota bacterium]